jgi:soluble lytic murein transglycosylase-like protein
MHEAYKKECKETMDATGFWDMVFLEFDPSIKGEIYRYIRQFETGLTDEEEAQLASLICTESYNYNCDPKLVLALIMVESSFYSKAVSSKGAKGLMQLRPHVAKALAQEVGIAWEEEAVIYDPEVNIRLGLYYLSQLILQFRDLKIALAAYNFGPTYIRERIELGMPLPTQYANKVLHKYQRLSETGSQVQGQNPIRRSL